MTGIARSSAWASSELSAIMEKYPRTTAMGPRNSCDASFRKSERIFSMDRVRSMCSCNR